MNYYIVNQMEQFEQFLDIIDNRDMYRDYILSNIKNIIRNRYIQYTYLIEESIDNIDISIIIEELDNYYIDIYLVNKNYNIYELWKYLYIRNRYKNILNDKNVLNRLLNRIENYSHDDIKYVIKKMSVFIEDDKSKFNYIKLLKNIF